VLCNSVCALIFRRAPAVLNNLFHRFIHCRCGFSGAVRAITRTNTEEIMDSKKVKKTATKIAKQTMEKIEKAAKPKVKQLKKAARSVAKDALKSSAKSLKKAAKAI
jgi:glutamyl-tRNA reductase